MELINLVQVNTYIYRYVVYDDKVQLLCVCDFVREEKHQNSLMSLWVFPDDGNCFDPSRSRVNVTVQNVVMNLRKLKTNVLWDHIKAGIDPKNLHVCLLVLVLIFKVIKVFFNS